MHSPLSLVSAHSDDMNPQEGFASSTWQAWFSIPL
ncbi:Uncharacterised protein [Vibrio cholerae]|nr:Uncharacterised protein [Vibrio cholerae]